MHFSIGFVAESGPSRPVASVCSYVLDRSEVTAIWPRDDGMNCVDHGCLSPGSICAPRGDDASIIFSVFDTDGDEFDLTGSTEIVFMVADSQHGAVRIVKKLTEGGVVLSSNGYQFMVNLTDDETDSLVRRHNYYEAQVTTSIGLKKTVSHGLLLAEDTMIRDLA